MSKDHAEYLSEEQIAAEVAELAKEIASGKKDEDELERDAYFSDPKNADEIEAMLERMKLAETMYKARHEAGLTQKQLAEILQTTDDSIYSWEKGRSQPSIETLRKICVALNVTADYLIGIKTDE